jgi:hypothetical protein
MLLGMSTLQRWRTEMQAGWLYREIARSEREPAKAQLFAQLAGTADEQAEILARDLIHERGSLPAFGPDLRARFAARFARAFGVRAARPLLAALKVRGLSVYSHARADGHAMPVSGGRDRRAPSTIRRRQPARGGSSASATAWCRTPASCSASRARRPRRKSC